MDKSVGSLDVGNSDLTVPSPASAKIQVTAYQTSVSSTSKMNPHNKVDTMKVFFYILLLLSSKPVNADEPLESKDEKQRLESVQQLVDANQHSRAVEELKAIIELHPKSAEAQTRLGALYALKLGQPAQGIPFLQEGWKLGNDTKALEALAIAYLLTGDREGTLQYKDEFLKNFERLGGARFVGFYIAATENDKALFLELLRKVTVDDIQKDDLMAKMIARAAKVVLEK